MIQKRKINVIFGAIASLILLLSFSSNPPNGNTGAPGDGTCSGCHSGSTGSGSGFEGNISLSGLPAIAEGGTVYNLTFDVNVTAGSPNRAGIQVVALKNSSNTNAGDMSNQGTGSNVVIHNSRDYLEHQPAQLFGGGNTVSYTVDWEAPGGSEEITFYAISLLGNGSGNGGDKQITQQFDTEVMGSNPLSVSITASTGVSCFGQSNGSATAEAIGGVPPYDFEWDNGETGSEANDLDGGFHTVTVTDDAGTEETATVNISEPNEINISISSTDITCFGEIDGTASASASGGTGTLSCSWSTGESSCVATDLDQGTYFVTVEDANGCEQIAEVVIQAPSMIMLDGSSTGESSPGSMDGTATAEATGGTGPYIFDWSNGETETGTESTITGLSEGVYNVTVTDENDCETMIAISVAGGGCAIEAEAFSTNITCNGASDGKINLSVVNGADPISYLWNNGATTQDLCDLPAGVYSVTIVDNGGCEFIVANLSISEPPALIVNELYTIDTECETDPDGEIAVSVSGGAGDFTLSWSTGVTNDTTIVIIDTLNNITETIINIPDTLSGILPGEYIYTLVDGDGCSVSDTITVENNDSEAPVLSLMEGTIYLDASGNADSAGFELVDNGSSDNCGITDVTFQTGSFDCSSLGTYDAPVSIADAAGNTVSGTAVFNVIDTIAPVLDCSMLEDIMTNSCSEVVFGMPTATDNCMVADISVVQGFESGSVFPSGDTEVIFRATDDCGNFSECSFTVTVNIDLQIASSVSNVTCFGGSDGSLVINATGGTAPYEYIINPPVDDLNNVPAGVYTVNVTDNANCLASETITITEPEEIDIPTILVTGSGWDAPEGIIELGITGGVEPYQVDLSDTDGNLIQTGVNQIFLDLAIGNYVVTVIDANGCESGPYNITVDSTSATIDPEKDSALIQMFPNPTQGNLNIINKGVVSQKFEIVRTDGTVISTFNYNSGDEILDVSELNSGLYFIRFYTAERMIIKQFLKI